MNEIMYSRTYGKTFHYLMVIASLIIQTSCSSLTLEELTQNPNPTKTSEQTPTFTNIPTVSPSPTSTLTPTPTLTATPLPAYSGTQVPRPQTSISADNAASVICLSSWGTGANPMIVFSSKENALYSWTSEEGIVQQWDLTDGTIQQSYPAPKDANFDRSILSPDGGVLVTSNTGENLAFWRVADGARISQDWGNWSFCGEGFSPITVTSWTMSAKDNLVAVGSEALGIEIWSRNGPERYIFSSQPRTIQPTPMPTSENPDANQYVPPTYSTPTYAQPTPFYLVYCQPKFVIVTSLAFSSDNNLLASSFENGEMYIWPAPEDKSEEIFPLVLSSQHENYVKSIAFSPDDKLLASGTDSEFQLWRTSDGSLIYTINLPAINMANISKNMVEVNDIKSIAFSPDGNVVAYGRVDGSLFFFRTSDGTLLQAINAHNKSIISLAFSPDGFFLVSSSADRTIRLWGVAP